ncbi:hypothetical protein BDDG_09873 [Blastomyces dermatitidis ATCC 18188]|uniref:ceramidase n=1 Tax=Ajellomyces dermatitidis (strain ATCC 18188 / CBS 674.68) TaxID=653446 RepID=F2TUK9_AJEDA|nr:hypothetical protein BDDG_09873 [Blastomyces dermatitidis ATCC 18188]
MNPRARPTDKNHSGDIPPVYRIDLSLPPAQRYVEVAGVYRERMRSLTSLFDELVESIFPAVNIRWVKRAARLLLRRLYTHEETEEIKGISQTADIPLYLLVSLNVLLDLLMGCTSGGARCRDAHDVDSKMLHFRTLDWDMDGLRQLIVQLEFVRSPHTEQVLATSITYVGFVGVLTGVRENLSVSLNFRPYHDTSRRFGNVKFYASHILVLLGIRRSISSLLRQCILPPAPTKWSIFTKVWRGARRPAHHGLSLGAIAAELSQTPTTAAYVIFSDGNSTTVLEKDYRSAVTRTSSSFIVATNSDIEDESTDSTTRTDNLASPQPQAVQLAGLEELVEDSVERRTYMQGFWDAKEKSRQSSHPQASTDRQKRDPLHRTRASRVAARQQQTAMSSSTSSSTSQDYEPQQGVDEATSEIQEVTASPAEIIRWTSTYPITNEMTHFATVMDPMEGKIVWVRRYTRPLRW